MTQKDISGTWTRDAFRTMDTNKSVSYVLKIELNSDGSFHQTIKISGDPTIISQTGTWTIDGSRVDLSNLLVEEWEQATQKGIWKPESTKWDIIDGPKRSFEVFGGLFPDPDSWEAFKKVQ